MTADEEDEAVSFSFNLSMEILAKEKQQRTELLFGDSHFARLIYNRITLNTKA
jgi:hypothetical protein